MRQHIRAETTKVESYHQFTDWIAFGGPVLRSGDPVEQEKRIKYRDLVANVVDIIQDEGTAKDLKRPGVQRLLGLVDRRQGGAVIVYKLDRLTRSVKDLNSLVEFFEKKGVALVSLQESLDTTTASGRLMMNSLASVSQWEREVIGERTKDAMAHLKQTGQVYSRPVFADVATLAQIHWLRAGGGDPARHHGAVDG